jgi:hypothetical protein
MSHSKISSDTTKEKSILSMKPRIKPNFDLVYQFEFQNHIPPVPFGPYYAKNLDGKGLEGPESALFHTYEEFGKYKESTLEKNYIWQPHFGFEVNKMIDLVDQEAVLHLPENPKLEALDEIIVRPQTTQRGGKSDDASTADISRLNPWWLRNTTYLENNLFSQTHKTKRETAMDLKRRQSLLKADQQNESGDIYQDMDPYEAVEMKMNELIQKKRKLGVEMEYSLDFLPDDVLANDTISFIRFDEPALQVSETRSKEVIQDLMNRSLITNIRHLQTAKLSKASAFECSLVIPKSSEKQADDEDMDLFGEDDTEEYVWVRDYIMDSQIAQRNDEFLLVTMHPPQYSDYEDQMTVDDFNEGVAKGSIRGKATYHPIRTRINLHKMAREDAKPVNVSVVRVDPDN